MECIKTSCLSLILVLGRLLGELEGRQDPLRGIFKGVMGRGGWGMTSGRPSTNQSCGFKSKTVEKPMGFHTFPLTPSAPRLRTQDHPGARFARPGKMMMAPRTDERTSRIQSRLVFQTKRRSHEILTKLHMRTMRILRRIRMVFTKPYVFPGEGIDCASRASNLK